MPSGSWERLLVVLYRGEDAIPHRLALLYSV